MPKNIKGTSSLVNKNVQNSESIQNLTANTIRANTLVATDATITNLTNTELQTATSNIATNTSDIVTLQTSKQDALTVSNPIDLTSDNLSLNIDNNFFFINSDGELQLKVILDYNNANVFMKTNRLQLQNDGDVQFDMFDDTDDYGFRIFFQHNTQKAFFRIRGDVGGYLDTITIRQDDVDFNSLDLLNVNSINSITSTEIGYLDGVTSSIQFQLDAKQATLTAGNGIDITAGIGTTISVDEAELTTKQDVITDSTDIELNDLNVNDTIFFQRNNSSDTNCNITRSSSGGKMRFNADGYAFKNETNGNNLLVISDSGTCTTVSVQADFFSGITNTELDYLDGATSNIQTQINGKQATITSSTALSCASINLNSGDITNGGDGAFSTITLNGSDLQDKIDAKSDAFGLLLPLELDPTAFPNPALKLNYNTTEFEVDTNDDLKLTGSLPTLTSDLNCGTNAVSGVTSLTCRSIELHNSSNNLSFLDFGGGDFRFRQIYNQTANTFQFIIDDATGENPEKKIQVERTRVAFFDADVDVNGQDLIGAKFIQGADAIKFYVDGDTTGGTDFTLDLKADGDADFNGGSLLNVEEVENAVKFVEWGGSPNSATNNLWGNDNIHDVWAEGVNVNATGMVSQASGVFTINEAGTYTIDCNATIENVNFNGRLVAGQYISVNDDTARFRVNPSSFAICYVRDDGFGVAGSISFSTTIVLAQNDTIRFKTKLGKNTDNRNYNDTHSETGLNWWAGVRFTKHLIA